MSIAKTSAIAWPGICFRSVTGKTRQSAVSLVFFYGIGTPSHNTLYFSYKKKNLIKGYDFLRKVKADGFSRESKDLQGFDENSGFNENSGIFKVAFL